VTATSCLPDIVAKTMEDSKKLKGTYVGDYSKSLTEKIQLLRTSCLELKEVITAMTTKTTSYASYPTTVDTSFANVLQIFDQSILNFDEKSLLPEQKKPRRSHKTSKMTAKCPDTLLFTDDILHNDTSTEFTATILPSNPSTKLDSISHNNNINNINNNNSQSIVYEEESYILNSDENYLATEDYEFLDSIRSPTFSGISLPSLCFDSSKYSILPTPSLFDVYNSVTVSSGLTINNQESLSCQPVSGVNEVLLVNKYNFDRRLSVYIIYLYIILVWDPGIFYSQSIYYLYYVFLHLLYCVLYL